MKNIPKTETRPFEIVIRDTPDSEPRVVETIQVEVIVDGEDDYLTPESSALIERVRARHMGLMMGEDIKAMRKRLGLSQKELTDLLQCGEKSLSRWENGRGQPTGLVNTMLRLLDEGYIAPSSLQAVQGPRRLAAIMKSYPAIAYALSEEDEELSPDAYFAAAETADLALAA